MGSVLHQGRARIILRRFLRDTRAGATAIAAVAVTVMSVGGTALIVDHVWLVDQRDTLKSASDAAGVAATLEMTRLMDTQPGISDADLKNALKTVAQRYVELNLEHLPQDRLTRARSTLDVDVSPDRSQGTVDVTVEADLGGFLLSKHMPMFGGVVGPEMMRAEAIVESVINPIEVVLAIDISTSMTNVLDGRSACPQDAILCGASLGAENARIAIVKRAATKLVEILEPAADNRVAVGVVPWHTVVRVDADTAADWSANDWARYPTRRVYPEPYMCNGNNCTAPGAVEQTLASTTPEAWRGCLDSHRLGSGGTRASLPATSVFFKPPSANAFAQLFFRAKQGSAYECLEPPLPANMGWQICYQGLSHNPWSTTGAPPSEPQADCPIENPVMLPLSGDGDTIREAIDSLAPIGSRTYSALGVLWGRRLLDHAWKNVWGGDVHPVDPDNVNAEGLRKAIVLLTDGEDTHCGLKNATCSDSDLGFSRTDACTAAKEAGTEIFVIAAMHPDKVSKELGDSLRECSSESDETDVTYAYLNHSTPEELEAAFADIANQLRVVRRVY